MESLAQRENTEPHSSACTEVWIPTDPFLTVSLAHMFLAFHPHDAGLFPPRTAIAPLRQQQEELRVTTKVVPEYYSPTSSSSSRIPRLRARRVTWELSTAQSDDQLTADLERLMVFGDDMNDDVEEALFPPLLQELSFSRDFKRATGPLTTSGGGGGLGRGAAAAAVVGPPSSCLQELVFGSYFNEAFDESLELPTSLTRVTVQPSPEPDQVAPRHAPPRAGLAV